MPKNFADWKLTALWKNTAGKFACEENVVELKSTLKNCAALKLTSTENIAELKSACIGNWKCAKSIVRVKCVCEKSGVAPGSGSFKEVRWAKSLAYTSSSVSVGAKLNHRFQAV